MPLDPEPRTRTPPMSKPYNIAMIGYGFMGRAHSNAYANVSHYFDLEYRPVLKAVCARDKDKAQAFANQWGYESVETDWKKLLARKDIDAVDICTPNNLHKEIAIAAAEVVEVGFRMADRGAGRRDSFLNRLRDAQRALAASATLAQILPPAAGRTPAAAPDA